jgi:hypothetical protein
MALANKIQSLLITHGEDATYTHFNPGTYDPSDGTFDTPATSTESIKCLTDSSLESLLGAFTQGNVELGSQRVYIAALALTTAPTVKDTITISSAVWKVINYKPLKVKGVAVLYEMKVSK